MRTLLLICTLGAGAVVAQEPAKKPTWYEKSVSKVDARFEPAEAKPGQTVTFSLTIELNEGYHTYPTRQVDPMALGMVNTFQFPKTGEVIFVGDVIDPKGYQVHAEPVLGIKEIRQYGGRVIFQRQAVVSPTAKAGEMTFTLPGFTLSVCDVRNCFPSKTLKPTAKLKILEGPALPVESKFAPEVLKAESGM